MHWIFFPIPHSSFTIRFSNDSRRRQNLFKAFQSTSAVRQAQAPSLVEGMQGQSSEETGGLTVDNFLNLPLP